MGKEYLELLKDPRWQKKKTEILQRDNFTCQHCGCKDKTLHVHHTYYDKDKNPWEYDNKSLITLCDKCHKCETEYKRDLYEQFKNLQYNWGKANLSFSVLSSLLSKIDWYITKAYGEEDEFNKFCNEGVLKDFIKECFYGVFNYYDCISADKLHIDLFDIVKNVHPKMLDNYNKMKEENGR